MFKEQDLLDFINKIINQTNQNQEQVKANILQFQEYLSLTKMASEDTLNNLGQVLLCLDEVLALKEKLGTFDISTLMTKSSPKEESNKVKEKKIKPSSTPYTEKHYHHYGSYTPTYTTSNSCGSSNNYNSYNDYSYRSSC